MHEMEQVFGAQARAKGLEFQLCCAGEVPAEVLGDQLRLRQILGNLLGNAVKFTSEGHVRLSVERTAEGKLSFAVCDTGVGIDEDARAGIFEEFTQADVSTSRRFGGTGLGLAICKGLLELMGGELQLESVCGEGSSFSFAIELPEVCSLKRETESELLGTDRGDPIEGARILLVEDHIVNQKVACRMLATMGAEVVLAEHGGEALDRLDQGQFDLILMDIQMPVMDGYEAARRIRARPGEDARIPILAMTANAMASDRAECFAAGMDDYLSKPVRRAVLRAALEDWLAQE